MEPTAVKYRPDIDGLRALAILPVVWFHSGLPGLPGGFTGVDTFFVISGYLITLIIHREVASGTFRFARFYERRVRRIAPALLLVMTATTIAAFALLLPLELERFGASAISALAMASNMYFWRAGGYFALAEWTTPLLHTWSLSVEEQFYLLFPALLLLSERARKTKLAVAALGLGSLAVSVIATQTSPAAAFYLLPSRGWELMIGASLAVGLVSIPERFRSLAGVAGIALLVAAALLMSERDPFPGWRALLPTIGAALVIGAGPATVSGRMLSLAPLVYVGKISYSLYLWHWPVFVFLRHYHASMDLPLAWSIAGMAASFALAALTYVLIERPARDRSVPYRTVLLFSAAAALTIALMCAAAALRAGLPGRLPDKVVQLAAQRDALAPLSRPCNRVPFELAHKHCRIGAPGRPTVMVWGDSHAATISEAAAMATGQPGVVVAQGGCAPTGGWTNPRLRGRDPAMCRRQNQQALSFAREDAAIRTVILSAYWNSHEREGAMAYWRSTQQIVDQLRTAGKLVVLVAGIPDPGVDVPWASAIRQRFGREPLVLQCPKPRIPITGATIVDVSAEFCRYPAAALMADSNHLTRWTGQKIVAPALARAVAAGQ